MESGNDASEEAGNISKVAAKHILSQKIPWPVHDDRHRRTILGARLWDEQCVRCWVESHAAEAEKKAAEAAKMASETAAPPRVS